MGDTAIGLRTPVRCKQLLPYMFRFEGWGVLLTNSNLSQSDNFSFSGGSILDQFESKVSHNLTIFNFLGGGGGGGVLLTRVRLYASPTDNYW